MFRAYTPSVLTVLPVCLNVSILFLFHYGLLLQCCIRIPRFPSYLDIFQARLQFTAESLLFALPFCLTHYPVSAFDASIDFGLRLSGRENRTDGTELVHR